MKQRLGRRSYLCTRSASFCPLRVVCWFSGKCPIGGPYFKKVGNSYVQQPANAELPAPRRQIERPSVPRLTQTLIPARERIVDHRR